MESRTKLLMELARLRGTADATVEDCCEDKLDPISQYLRLPDDYCQESSLEVVKDRCLLAYESQILYRSNSLKQWLRTVVSEDQDTGNLIVHSNVIPRQAYSDATCPGSHRCRGFSVSSEISRPRSCKDCALADQMRIEIGHMDVDHPNTLLHMEDQVQDVLELAEGVVYKILWRSGTFVRKRFNCEGLFYRELDVVTNVSHPNIVHCFGFSCPELYVDSKDKFDSEDDEDAFQCDMFMEYLDVDLQRFLDEAGEGSGYPFSFRDSLDVLLQVAEAMNRLHERNFLHGDLKPQNIFISRFELAHSGVHHYLAKVGDFGCAQRVDASGATVKPFHADIGTTSYIAPEVLRCRRRFGGLPPPRHPQKIDVYSFGVVAYQVLTGVARLYVGKSRIAESILSRGLRPNRGFKGTLDEDRSSLVTYIGNCWAENPEERPSFSQICEKVKNIMIGCSNVHGVRGNMFGKRKHHNSIGEGASSVKSIKAVMQARNGMA